jgi:hypothetical protein
LGKGGVEGDEVRTKNKGRYTEGAKDSKDVR